MIRAYSEDYLLYAQKALALMLDYAVRDCGFELEAFYKLFLASSIAKRFGRGEPNIVVGKSGVELAVLVLEENGLESKIAEPSWTLDRSQWYWTGWALAYYQWCTSVDFSRLNEEVPIGAICYMYHPYHEMDIIQVVDAINKKRQAARIMTYLKYFREQMGLTQAQLSEQAQVPVKTIQQYEQRQKNINKASAETVISLAQALNVRPIDLMEPQL